VIESLLAELGDHVRAGQPLARLESADQTIAVATADVAYDNAGRTAARARLVTRAGGITPADSELIEVQLRQAEIARRKAQRDLELTRVTAPFDGIVTARAARLRRYVAVGDTLFRVTEASPLYARVHVPAASARALRVGDSATVVGSGSATGHAVVEHAAPMIDAASGTRELVLRLHNTTAFLPGESVTIRLGAERRRVLAVSRDAIDAEGYAIVADQGRTVLRPVTVGADLGDGRVEIVSGLARGERLVRPGR
jgi:membrane fusion protein, multidrug efflux system